MRAAIGTFGIDAPLGYEEAMTLAADWWSSDLDGNGVAGQSTLLRVYPQRHWLTNSSFRLAQVCFKRSAENRTSSPSGRRMEANRNEPWARGNTGEGVPPFKYVLPAFGARSSRVQSNGRNRRSCSPV